MKKIKIYGDFNNTDSNGNIRLNVNGSLDDIERQKIELKDGMAVVITDFELEISGYTKYSIKEKIWVACVNWFELKELKNS